MTKVKALEAVLKRDRLVMVMALGVLTIIAALYTVFGVGMRMSAIEMTAMADEPMTGMGAMAMQPAEWSLAYFGLVFLMWWVMMVAMMLPSAAPMILLYAAVKRKSEPEIEIRSLMSLFLVGYLLIWAGFSLGAAGLQWVLELRGLVSATMMTATSGALGGAILLAAGLYQFTPIKQACLRHCRSPVHESLLDRGDRILCPLREVPSRRPLGCARRGRGPDHLGQRRRAWHDLNTRKRSAKSAPHAPLLDTTIAAPRTQPFLGALLTAYSITPYGLRCTSLNWA